MYSMVRSTEPPGRVDDEGYCDYTRFKTLHILPTKRHSRGDFSRHYTGICYCCAIPWAAEAAPTGIVFGVLGPLQSLFVFIEYTLDLVHAVLLAFLFKDLGLVAAREFQL